MNPNTIQIMAIGSVLLRNPAKGTNDIPPIPHEAANNEATIPVTSNFCAVHEKADPYCQETANPIIADPAYNPKGDEEAKMVKMTAAMKFTNKLNESIFLGQTNAAIKVPKNLPIINPPLYELSDKAASLAGSFKGPHKPKVKTVDWKIRSIPHERQ